MSAEPIAETYARLRRVAEDLPELPGMGAVEIADGHVVVMLSPVKRHAGDGSQAAPGEQSAADGECA